MKRIIDTYLSTWKNTKKRKVLLVRGARQVGKTYAVRKLGQQFEHLLEVNFEEEPEIKMFFAGSRNPLAICQKLSAYFDIPIIPGKTLLFLDEIQSCVDAISALRFFYEKIPDLHVAAAGSLLEFALDELPSYGVGRITSCFMYPLAFEEFMLANGHYKLWAMVDKISKQQPIDTLLHQRLVEQVRLYQLIGGMPEVVQTYIDSHDLRQCQQVLSNLLQSLRDDFAKYKEKSPVILLNEVLTAIARQAGNKFVYSHVDTTTHINLIKQALDLLVKAGLAYKIYHTSAQGVPLGAQTNLKKFKVILFDVGIHQHLLGLNISDYLLAKPDELVNKGNIAETMVGLELVKYHPVTNPVHLYYWQREARSSQAELDYIVEIKQQILPIEVKAGVKGRMQSMRLFMKERALYRGIRFSLENFSHYEDIDVLPLYAVKQLWQEASF